MNQHGIALILSGASGTGKSTVCAKVRMRRPELYFSISCTTRAPRPGEKDGVDYYFITPEIFEQRLAAGEFIETANVYGYFYGTLKTEVTDRVRCGQDVILDIDIQGAAQIRQLTASDAVLSSWLSSVFIGPPSFSELERRLRNRGTETEEVILRRLATAKKELTAWASYDYVLVNEDSDQTAEAILNIIDVLHWRTCGKPEDLFDAS